MKNLFLVLSCILLGTQVLAADFLLTSNKPVKSVYVRDDDILSAKALYTIDNTKENIILSPKKDGKSLILVNLFDEEIFIDIKVKDGEIIIKPQNGFECFSLDNPPEELEIIPPPHNIK